VKKLPSTKNVSGNVVTLLVTVLIIFILIEIGLRFVLVPASWPREQAQASDNPIILYELKPDLDLIERGPIVKLKPVRVKTNSNGLREDEEHEFEKDRGTYRIAVVGDSLTFGMFIEQNETFGHRLELLLNENVRNRKFETLNFGVPGYNTNQELEVIQNKALAYDPDMILLLFSPNDFTNVSETHALSTWRRIGSHIYSVRLGYWVWYRQIRLTKEYTGITNQAWDYVKIPLEEIADISESHDITFVVIAMSFGKPDAFYADYSSVQLKIGP